MKHPWLFLFMLAGMVSFLYAGNADVLSLLVQENTDRLEVSTSLTRIDARVRDKEGSPVRGLKAEDFEIYQDGRLQTVTEFHEINSENKGMAPRIIVFIRIHLPVV